MQPLRRATDTASDLMNLQATTLKGHVTDTFALMFLFMFSVRCSIQIASQKHVLLENVNVFIYFNFFCCLSNNELETLHRG